MRNLAEYDFPAEARTLVGPVLHLIERGYRRQAEVSLAGLMLWTLKQLDEGTWTAEQADQVFTLLSVYLVERYGALPLSGEAEALIIEGEHFHHYGETTGPDREHLQSLAKQLLDGGALVPA